MTGQDEDEIEQRVRERMAGFYEQEHQERRREEDQRGSAIGYGTRTSSSWSAVRARRTTRRSPTTRWRISTSPIYLRLPVIEPLRQIGAVFEKLSAENQTIDRN
ncbi:MAG: hypothetical protein JWO69_1775 [Thermoleophilia bacterium]|nr:hypothetical protein [Thermoleophilia bacterium]